MDPEEFRAAGHELIDWIADFRAGIGQYPVKAQVKPGEVRHSFPETAPADPCEIGELLRVLDSVVVPGMTHVQHPMFFGWFPANGSLASVLGDLASSGLGGLGISWESAPALTEVEEVVCDWMRELTGLSESWRGTIHDTASTSALTALLVARERATELSQNRGGLIGTDRPLVVYTTDQAHSSVAKAALLAGYGWDNIREVATDPTTSAMDPAALAAAIAKDLESGKVPAAIVLGVGTTGVTAFDPIDAIVDVIDRLPADAVRPWVHADAAMAGSVLLLPEMRFLAAGIERADSITWNPHKWMGTILDTSLFYVRDVEMLNRVMSTNPSYLQSPESDDPSNETAVQYRDWGIPLGRRFRAMKLWFHLSLDGIESIQSRLRRDLDNARWLAAQVEAADDWELVSPLTLQTVCLRHRHLDIVELVRTINQSGQAFLSPTKHGSPGAGGEWIARVSVGSMLTERHHVEAVWELLCSAASDAATTSSEQSG